MPTSLFSIPSAARYPSLFHGGLRKTNVAVCFVLEDTKQSVQIDNLQSDQSEEVNYQILTPRAAERLARKKSEMFTYLVAAMMSSFGITSMAVMACYYRFYWQMEVCFNCFPLSLIIEFQRMCILELESLWRREERCLYWKYLAHFLYQWALL